MPEDQPTTCPCGKAYTVGHVLRGWRPCHCGGHSSWHCRDDRGGCGHTHHQPELQDSCTDPRIGYSPS